MNTCTPGGRRLPRSARAAVALAGAALVAMSLASTASASHIKGGTIYAEINGDQVTGNAAYYEDLEGSACTVGDVDDTRGPTVLVTDPNAVTGNIDTELLPAVCPDNGAIGIWRGDFSADLSDVLATEVVDGEYLFSMGDCCMIEGIVNAPAIEEFAVQARVLRAAGQTRYSPRIPNSPRLGIPLGGEFFDALAPSVPGGSGPFGATSLAGTDLGPDTDIVTINPNETLSIPASVTGTLQEGDPYLYSVRVTDEATGNYSDRTVVLIAGLDDGLPPVENPDATPPTPPLPPAPRIAGKVKPLKKAKGLTFNLVCQSACAVKLDGRRALKKRTKEPNWGSQPFKASLTGGKVTPVTLKFSKQLRKTIRRGLKKGINPIKFQIEVTINGVTTTFVARVRF